MEQDWTTPGSRLRYARKFCGLSQAALGQLLDLPQNRISDWELGRFRPTRRTCRDLGEVLGVGWHWIYDGSLVETVNKDAHSARHTLAVEDVSEATGDAATRAERRIRSRRGF